MAETSSYDALGHLTSIQWSNWNPNYPGWSAPTGVSYTYPASGNNGQITQMTDAASGEAVSYTYDVLKRLVSASAVPTAGSSASPWTQNYQYDGFGNLTAKVLNGVTTSIPVNGSTNRLTNASYDANGNMTSGAGATYGYDESNRISYVAPVSGGTESYRYAPDNKRIYKLKADGTEEFTFYGARGEKLGVYQFYNPTSGSGYYPPATYQVRALSTSIWFGGRLIWDNGAVGLDRLGTNRSAGRFRPYGDPTTSVATDKVGFATYARDGFSGLDYADQRYYASSYGRFNTADPYQASGGPASPASWNRYSYTRGDPINRRDRSGLADTTVEVHDTVGDLVDVGGSGRPGGDNDKALPGLPGGYGEDAPELTDKTTSSLSFQERVRDYKWMLSDWSDLNSFNSSVPCDKLLKATGLTESSVRNYAGGGAQLIDIRSLNPALQAKFTPGADFTKVPANGAGAGQIVYNIANYWQASNAEKCFP